MTLIIKDPFDALVPLREAMNRLLEESFVGPGRFETFISGRPFPIDLYETEDHTQYVIEASLPGIKPEDLKITALGDTLTILVTKKEEEKIEKGTYMRRERYEGDLSRTIVLPTPFDPEKILATYEHGLLKLVVPKVEEALPKQIPVTVREPVGAR